MSLLACGRNYCNVELAVAKGNGAYAPGVRPQMYVRSRTPKGSNRSGHSPIYASYSAPLAPFTHHKKD